jgi:hypothetical protein
MGLRIVTWNCHSARYKDVELSNFLKNHFHHFVLLQETWLSPKVTFKIPGYVCLRQDRETFSQSSHGGVAILIHNSIASSCSRIKFVELDIVESIFVQVSFPSFSFVLGSIYSPATCSAKNVKGDIQKLLTRPGPFVFAGDFNAKHPSWNNVNYNYKGVHLRRICDENLCEIHHSEETTCFPATGELSLIDFVVSKGVIGVSKPTVYDELSSDHMPVSFDVPVSSAEFPDDIKVKNFLKANWKLFRALVTTDIEYLIENHPLESTQDIDEFIAEFKQIIDNAITKTVPLKSPHVYRYPFSAKIADLCKRRNAVRKLARKTPQLKLLRLKIRELDREIRFETMSLKQQEWNKFCASLNIDDQSLYRLAKSLKNKKAPVRPLQVAENDFVFSSKGKADAIAEKFHDSHIIDQRPTVHTQAVQATKILIEQSPSDFSESERIFVSEVKSCVESLKVKKASGHDDISNRVVKNLPPVALELLAKIYNCCLRLSYFPTTWKIGKVVPIPKPGKDHSLPSSYRPITLLPTFGKMFEKLILERMLEFEKEARVLINQQFGFRSKHSTTQQVLRITEKVSQRFNEDKSTAMVLLDIEKAFDSVWHDALLHKLREYNYPIYLIKMIASFLENRVSYVSVDGTASDRYDVPAGVPQGSPSAPHLFIIYNNDMPIPQFCKIAVYADDTALISSVKNHDMSKLAKRIALGLVELENYFSSWKIRLNQTKTEAILFSKSTKMGKLKNENKISFGGRLLEWKDYVKYLGVTLDSKLTFKAHIAESLLKARKAMSSLYCLLKRTSTLSESNKITLYRSYIRPIMTYAVPVFSNCANCHMQKLQVLQNKCLRMALNAPYRTRISTLHRKTKIPTIKSFASKLTENFYKNSAKSFNPLVSRLGVYLPSALPPKHRLPRPV